MTETLAVSTLPTTPVGQSWKDKVANNGIWVALFGLIIFNLIATSNFASLQTVQTNLGQMATVGIAAVGMTLIMATGGIDLSVGSVMAVSGAAAGFVILSDISNQGNSFVSTLVILGVTVIAAVLFGLLNGFLVGSLGIQPIVATLAVMITARGIAQLITSGRLYAVENEQILWLGRGKFLSIPVMAWIMLAIFTIAIWVCNRTVFGRQLVAVGGNAKAAQLAGVPTVRIKYIVYCVGAALAAVAALMSVGVNGTVDTANLGLGYEFSVISAVVVGGTSLVGGRPKLLGTLGGVVLLQLLTFTLASHNIPKEVASLIQAAVIVLAVSAQIRKRK